MKQWFVYILASERNGTLYIGITNDLARRVDEHRYGAENSFTKKYNIHKLVYYELFDNPNDAIHREKNMKAWKRVWKLRAIEDLNPDWEDLAEDLLM